jgi:hypothetical protein
LPSEPEDRDSTRGGTGAVSGGVLTIASQTAASASGHDSLNGTDARRATTGDEEAAVRAESAREAVGTVGRSAGEEDGEETPASDKEAAMEEADQKRAEGAEGKEEAANHAEVETMSAKLAAEQTARLDAEAQVAHWRRELQEAAKRAEEAAAAEAANKSELESRLASLEQTLRDRESATVGG